ncbi:MAG TPA: HIT domain-containing protein [Candidatus Brocadiia bacterium]|nr:HIT domain-containing protein [Candidatus Brocadiia bacterium]
MDQLFAPWRMEYIRNVLPDEGGCFLCAIGRQKPSADNLVILQGTDCFCVINKYPYSNGHMLIAPYRHGDDIAGMTDVEMLEMMKLTARVKDTLQALMRAHGFNVGLNIGRVAGAGLEGHLHMHIVPRWNGDTNFMPVIGDTKIIPQALSDLWKELRGTIGQ